MVAAVALAHRQEWARVLAVTTGLTRDLDLAQECTQDAYAKALSTWPDTGVPSKPGAWLTTVARNRARDLLRRESLWRRNLPELVIDDRVDGPDVDGPDIDRPVLDDDRLRLIFTCCHPALSGAAQVALTLRLVCGLSTAEVARGFLVSESTMAARITRAKKKIAAARIPFRVPAEADLPSRLGAVLQVVHLIFTTGHTAPTGRQLERRDLVESATDLARLLLALLPSDRDVMGLLALILLTDARSDTRYSTTGSLVLLADQDRSRWDRARIREGSELVRAALTAAPRPIRYAIAAAIAAAHAEVPTFEDTDWCEIVGLYDLLAEHWPTPVIDLNRAVAIGFRDGPAAGLAALDPLLDEPSLATYSYLAASRADFLRRLGRKSEAASAYAEALVLTDNAAEADFLAGQWAEVRGD